MLSKERGKYFQEKWDEMEYKFANMEMKQQIEQLTNNWNELEEWIMQDVKDEKPDLYFQVLRKIDILDKMKEIKGGKNVSDRD